TSLIPTDLLVIGPPRPHDVGADPAIESACAAWKPTVGVALTALTAVSAMTWASVPESRIVFRADPDSTRTAVTASPSEAPVVNSASTWAEKQESLDVA